MGALSYFKLEGDSRMPYEMVEQGDVSESSHDSQHDTLLPFRHHNPLLIPQNKRRKVMFLLGTLCTIFVLIWQSASSSWFVTPEPPVEFPLPGVIPNIAHFVRQMNRHPDGTPKPFSYEFRHFMAYYSAHYHLKPDSINLWSDVTEDVLADARLNGDAVTKAVLSIPNLKFHYVTFPNQTTTGTKIKEYAHKSDFVRTRMMAEQGGQYFDDDAWVIKDLAPFRTAGFDNVFGLEWGGDVCQAAWMATPNNTLMNAFAQLQETVFDGGWLTASNTLITNLIKDIRGYGHDRHALILERNALFPGQWDTGPNGLPMYYKVHDTEDGTEMPPVVNSMEELVAKYRKGGDHKWRRDWRNTYVIHGYSNAIRAEHAQWVFDPYGGFTPEYILSQKSNIGRALYPALKDAVEKGYITVEQPTQTPPPADDPAAALPVATVAVTGLT